MDAVLNKVAIPADALFSTLGRVAARAIETKVIGEAMGALLGQLVENIKKGDLNICDERTWDQMPAEGMGAGLTTFPWRRAGALDRHQRQENRQLPDGGSVHLEYRPARRGR